MNEKTIPQLGAQTTKTVTTSIIISLSDLTIILRKQFNMPNGELIYGSDGYDFPLTFSEAVTTVEPLP